MSKYMDFGGKYIAGILKDLLKRTEHYPIKCFEAAPDEPSSASAEVLRLHRLKHVVRIVIRIGEKKFYELPQSLKIYCQDKQNKEKMYHPEDWVQEAMKALFEHDRTYIPEKGISFNKYVFQMVNFRLIDAQRELSKQVSLRDKTLQQMTEVLGRELQRAPTVEELSAYANCDIDTAQEFLLIKWQENQTPEQRLIHEEGLKTLGDCINGLQQVGAYFREIFVLHEFEKVPFKVLFHDFGEELGCDSQRTFQRHYEKYIYTAVKNCVLSHYNASSE